MPDTLAPAAAPGLYDPAAALETAAAVGEAVQQLGLTYGGGDRPWPFDPIPLVLDHDAWGRIEAGLAQRARLFERLLQDLYGPMRVLAEGLLPPELVFANPGFLRPCSGIRPRGGWLTLYAADLVRLGESGWAVLSDRTQAPSGLGYALANRVLSSRVVPELLAQLPVAPPAAGIDMLATALRRLSPRPQPRGVVLTPGPFSETHAEHALLARQLGFALVRGDELRVAGGAVHLETLAGPQRIDVMLRRIDDLYADPLVLRGDSLLGAAGLVAAARDGTIGLANALGAGAVEAPGLIPYLPGLALALLGEALILPSVETMWLGEPAALARWRQEPQRWVVKGAFAGDEPRFPGDPDSLDRVTAAPGRYAAQRLVAPSRLPVLGETGPGRPVVLRGYAIAGEAGAMQVMPGGLVRFGPATGAPVVSMQQGGGAKDCWVLGPAPAVAVAVTPPAAPTVPLPRRLADNLFWLGRYLERAAAEAGRDGGDPAAAIGSLRRIARDLRDRLGAEVWRSLECLFAAADRAAIRRAAAVAEAAIDRAAAGVPEGIFVAAGRRIERGLQTIVGLQTAAPVPAALVHDPAEPRSVVNQLEALASLFAQITGAPAWAAAAREMVEARLASLRRLDPDAELGPELRASSQTLAGVSDLLTRLCFASPRRAA